jgi:hypothetical protein
MLYNLSIIKTVYILRRFGVNSDNNSSLTLRTSFADRHLLKSFKLLLYNKLITRCARLIKAASCYTKYYKVIYSRLLLKERKINLAMLQC